MRWLLLDQDYAKAVTNGMMQMFFSTYLTETKADRLYGGMGTPLFIILVVLVQVIIGGI